MGLFARAVVLTSDNERYFIVVDVPVIRRNKGRIGITLHRSRCKRADQASRRLERRISTGWNIETLRRDGTDVMHTQSEGRYVTLPADNIEGVERIKY